MFDRIEISFHENNIFHVFDKKNFVLIFFHVQK